MASDLTSNAQVGGFMPVDRFAKHPGANIWWVDSTTGTDGAAYGKTIGMPCATIAYAVALAAATSTAGVDDTIYVLPAHTETIGLTGAAALTLSIAGLRVKGLGENSQRPALLVDAFTDTYISITGADTVLENFTIKAGHSNIAVGISIAAAGVEIRNCDILQNTTDENFLVGIQTTAAADDLLIEGCRITGVDTSNTEGIELVGATNRVTIRNNYLKGSFVVSAIAAITNACLDLQICGNQIINLTAGDDLAGCIDLVAASTGMVSDNMCYMEDNTDCLTSIDGGNCARAGNFCANELDQEGGIAAGVGT